jgi:enamine deaminase RidA (YjgF/YER057c/UK114 family)
VELRPPLPSAGLYNSIVVEGGFAFTSGTVAVEGDPLRLAYPGCLGRDISIEDAQLSARGAIISTLGNLSGSLGGLERVERFVKLVGYVRATPDFEHTPKVMDGASQLLLDVFGRELLPARTAIGVSSLPGGASVEVDTIVKLT